MKFSDIARISHKLTLHRLRENIFLTVILFLVFSLCSVSVVVGYNIAETADATNQSIFTERDGGISYTKSLSNISSRELNDVFSAAEQNSIPLGSFRGICYGVNVMSFQHNPFTVSEGKDESEYVGTASVYLPFDMRGDYSVGDEYETYIGIFSVVGFSDEISRPIADIQYICEKNLEIDRIIFDTNSGETMRDAIGFYKQTLRIAEENSAYAASEMLDVIIEAEQLMAVVKYAVMLACAVLLVLLVVSVSKSISISVERNISSYRNLIINGTRQKSLKAIICLPILTVLVISLTLSLISVICSAPLISSLSSQIVGIVSDIVLDGYGSVTRVDAAIPFYVFPAQLVLSSLCSLVIINRSIEKTSFLRRDRND